MCAKRPRLLDLPAEMVSLSRLYMRTCRLVPPFCGAKAKTNQVKEEEKEVSRQSHGNITCRQAHSSVSCI